MSRQLRITHGDTDVTADVTADGAVAIDGRHYRVEPAGAGRYHVVDDDGHRTLVAVAGPAHALWATAAGQVMAVAVDDATARVTSRRQADGDMTAPMPATVVKVAVAVGDRVEAGAPVVVLEAMKMELTVRASTSGVVRAIGCAVGDLVQPGRVLVDIDG